MANIKRDPILTVRMSERLKRAIQREAKRESRTLSSWVRLKLKTAAESNGDR